MASSRVEMDDLDATLPHLLTVDGHSPKEEMPELSFFTPAIGNLPPIESPASFWPANMEVAQKVEIPKVVVPLSKSAKKPKPSKAKQHDDSEYIPSHEIRRTSSKRKFYQTVVESVQSDESVSSRPPITEKRREENRESAKRARQKKQNHLAYLEHTVSVQAQRIEELETQVFSLQKKDTPSEFKLAAASSSSSLIANGIFKSSEQKGGVSSGSSAHNPRRQGGRK
jgi:hypothetical protein